MTTDDEGPVVYTLEELTELKAGLDEFFESIGGGDYETKLDIRTSGWSAHFKLPRKFPSVTNNLTGVARITHPALISQLIDQLVSHMEESND